MKQKHKNINLHLQIASSSCFTVCVESSTQTTLCVSTVHSDPDVISGKYVTDGQPTLGLGSICVII